MPTQKSSKSFTIEAVMRDPKMRRALKDALEAPAGSTKRKSASSMISSLYKISSRKMDGQGGGGAYYDKKNPWSRFKMPEAKPVQSDGQGGLGTLDFSNPLGFSTGMTNIDPRYLTEEAKQKQLEAEEQKRAKGATGLFSGATPADPSRSSSGFTVPTGGSSFNVQKPSSNPLDSAGMGYMSKYGSPTAISFGSSFPNVS